MNKIFLILLLFMPLNIFAQGIISGVVTSSQSGEVIEGVIVRLRVDDRDVDYALSSSEGYFEIVSNHSNGKLIFSHLSFTNRTLSLDGINQNLTVTLTPKVVNIKEITVSAPNIRVRGDTISYALGAFVGINDVSLEDALKKLPGVKISESGSISYLGKDISKFYIEGLDLLGGRYSLATSNIRADMVTTVDVMENHQSVIMLKDRVYSDEVAVNIKLKPEAKFVPSGTLETTVGYRDNDILYRLGLTGMLFSKEFQTISTIKYGNVGAQSSNENTIHFVGMSEGRNLASNILSISAGSTPPLPNDRYRSINDGAASVNTINTLGQSSELRVNANYSYTDERYSYSTSSLYYVGDAKESVEENLSPHTVTHRPSIELNYNHNGKDNYISNTLKGNLSIQGNTFNVLSGGLQVYQGQDALAYDVSNRFSYNRLIGEEIFSITSTVAYLATPYNEVSFSSALSGEGSYIQNANGTTIYSNNTVNYSLPLGSNFRIFLPLNLNYSYDRLKTSLTSMSTTPNDLHGYTLSTSLSPRVEYKTRNGRVEVVALLPVNYSHLDYNRAPEVESKLLLTPTFTARYKFSPSSIVTLKASGGKFIGDATNFLVNPIQTSYRTASVRSGILAEDESYSAILGYDFKKPLSYLFFSAEVGYDYSKRNLLPSQLIVGEDVITSTILSDNSSQGINAVASVSKHFRAIGLKANLSGHYGNRTGNMQQQGELIPYNSSYYGTSFDLSFEPLEWFELKYNGAVGWTETSYLNLSSVITSQNHSATLTVNPIKGFKIYGRADYIHNMLSSTQSIDMALVDIGVSYRFKRWEIGVGVNNVLDTKQYAYTLFNGLDTFSYNYILRGREFVLYFKLF